MLGKIALNYSPNFTTKKRIKKNIRHLIPHYTGMSSESKAIKRLIDEHSKVSCHYFIKRNGQIILMVPDLYIAWHAGQSNWNKENSLNRNSMIISKDVIYTNLENMLRADVIEIDIKTKNTKIFMLEDTKKVNIKSIN